MKYFRIIKGAQSDLDILTEKEQLKTKLIQQNAQQFSYFKSGNEQLHVEEFIAKLKQITSSLTNDSSNDIAKRIEKAILEHHSSSIDTQGQINTNIITGLL